MKYICGIDPGLTGAIALYRPEPLDIVMFDMPARWVNAKRKLDLTQLGTWFDRQRSLIEIAVIENVHSMPKQGVASSFSFGFAAGGIQGIVAANAIPMHLVVPAVWKTALKLKGGRENKGGARQMAIDLFPTFQPLFTRAKDDGRAEALLMAYWWKQRKEK